MTPVPTETAYTTDTFGPTNPYEIMQRGICLILHEHIS